MSTAKVSRRTLLGAALTGAAATFGTAACGRGTSGSSSSTESLRYWDYYVSQAGWVDNEIKLFQQAHKDVRIEKTTQVTDKYADLVSLSFRGGDAPEVFLLPGNPPLPDQVAKGWLLPLDKWATPAWQKKFPAESFYEGGNVFGGKVYSAPFGGHAPWLQLYIHHGVFRDAGLVGADGKPQLPKTWDDVTRAADTITKKSGGKTYGLGFGNAQNGPLSWWLELFVRGAGAPGGSGGQDLRTGKWTYATDRAYTDFLTLLLDWKQRGLMYPNSMSISDEQARAFFERGKFGMTVGGVWNQPEWSDHKFTDYSLVTLPSPTETPKAYFYASPGGTLMGISAKAKHPEEAWAWFDWIYSPAAGKRWVEMGQGLSVFEQSNDPKAVKFAPFAQYVETRNLALIGPTPTIRNPELSKVVLAPVKPDINDVLAGLYTGQLKDMGAALSELADRQYQALSDGVKKAKEAGAKVSLDDYVFADWDPTQAYTTKRA
ncbi:ABC transporter substrate-binding protein [Flindersiella endophytica]